MTMLTDPSVKYSAFPQVPLSHREWPGRVTTKAPIWLSTDLRDGNQSLIDPMDAEKKARFFDLLVKCGFKEIEVGFPSAGATEFDFISGLVKNGRIPEGVTPQVLTQSRADLIRTSFDSLEGAKTAIVHVYNAVSPAWRKIVFNMEMPEIKGIAIEGAKQLRDNAARLPGTDWRFQYSPETFSTAELDFSIECCEAVMQILQPTAENPIILNLPATVEASTANIYADQIEYFCKNLPNRDRAIISLHTHNDRGTGVAAAELGLLAGADRVEGCLFGNGERTGNLDLVNVALNLYTQGVAPGLDFSDIDRVRRTVEHCNQLPVSPRHPYVGELVYTSFSGSHQDAIKKGFAARRDDMWEMPYLPIDPKDLGRSYEAVIRVNSQSGKGGIAYLLESEYGLQLPRRLQIEFSAAVQREMDASGKELTAADLWALFQSEYQIQAVAAPAYRMQDDGGRMQLAATVQWQGDILDLEGEGTGPIDAFVQALSTALDRQLRVLDYTEHAIGEGANAQAVAYVEMRIDERQTVYGVGMDANIVSASMRAILSGLQRAPQMQVVAA